MSILEGLIAAIFTMVVVFLVLICLYVLMNIFSFAIRKFEVIGRKSTE